MFQMLVTKLSLHMYPRCVSGCRSFPVFPVDSTSYLVATVTICSHKMLSFSSQVYKCFILDFFYSVGSFSHCNLFPSGCWEDLTTQISIQC